MRQVARIPDERQARRLADHLLTRQITTRVDRAANGWIVWIHREEKLDEARREVAEFLANPDDPKYDGVAKVAEAVRREAAMRERHHRRNTVNLSGRLNTISFRRCPVTYGLIAASVAVAILTRLGHDARASQGFMLAATTATIEMKTLQVGGDEDEDPEGAPRTVTLPVPRLKSTGLDAIRGGQVWRLITPIFLHFGIPHLAFNMMFLYQYGGLIELRRNKWTMLALVLSTGIASNLAEYFWEAFQRGPDALIRFGGMSGVCFALFGYCWMKSDYDPQADIKIPSNSIVYMMLWLGVCMTGMIGPIANAAHVVGLASGLVIGLTPHLFRDWRWW